MECHRCGRSVRQRNGDREDRRLVLRLLSGNEEILLLLEEQKTVIEPASLHSLRLTRRESEVLAHMANGLNKARIAEMLGASPRTVDAHVQKIMESLGVSSSTAAAAKAFQASRLDSYPAQAKPDGAEIADEMNRRMLKSG